MDIDIYPMIELIIVTIALKSLCGEYDVVYIYFRMFSTLLKSILRDNAVFVKFNSWILHQIYIANYMKFINS